MVMVIKVGSGRRIYLPKTIQLESDRLILLPFGTGYLLIPVPAEIREIETPLTRKELKELRDRAAAEDAKRILDVPPPEEA
ncbi:MAG: hypothetical protein ACE5R6_02080 [Candidatus Heimdallarchaeota archaeon]